MTIEEAIKKTIEKFPFKNYIEPKLKKRYGPYFNIANAVKSHLKPGSSILDFGCGPCDKTAVLQFLGFNCSAYDDLNDDWHLQSDNKEKIISFAKEFGIDLKHGNEGLGTFKKESFDMIMVNDVIEHLHDSPRDLLNDLLELAKPDGIFFVTVPNAVNIRKRIAVLTGKTNLPPFGSYYWYPGSWRGHIREYVRNDLILLAEYLNLEILELRGVDHMLQKVPKFLLPFYLFITGIFQGWKDSWLLVAKKKPNWKPIRTQPENKG